MYDECVVVAIRRVFTLFAYSSISAVDIVRSANVAYVDAGELCRTSLRGCPLPTVGPRQCLTCRSAGPVQKRLIGQTSHLNLNDQSKASARWSSFADKELQLPLFFPLLLSCSQSFGTYLEDNRVDRNGSKQVL